jgi:gliding motility-associated-like protein
MTTISLNLGQPAPVLSTAVIVNDTCYGLSDGSITLTPAGGFSPYTYAWTQIPGNSSNTASALAAGVYTAVVTDAHGCQETVSDTVGQPAEPVLAILPSDTTLSFGDTIQLYSQFGPASLGTVQSYLWADTNSALSCTTCPMPYLASNDSVSSYSLTVTYNNNLCTASATTLVVVNQQDTFAVADAFTPNGDSKNDTYFIQAKEVRSFHIDIYDRWGQTVFSSNDITQGWDGTYKGTAQPTGVYIIFFSLEYGKNKSIQRTANITLLR